MCRRDDGVNPSKQASGCFKKYHFILLAAAESVLINPPVVLESRKEGRKKEGKEGGRKEGKKEGQKEVKEGGWKEGVRGKEGQKEGRKGLFDPGGRYKG